MWGWCEDFVVVRFFFILVMFGRNKVKFICSCFDLQFNGQDLGENSWVVCLGVDEFEEEGWRGFFSNVGDFEIVKFFSDFK